LILVLILLIPPTFRTCLLEAAEEYEVNEPSDAVNDGIEKQQTAGFHVGCGFPVGNVDLCHHNEHVEKHSKIDQPYQSGLSKPGGQDARLSSGAKSMKETNQVVFSHLTSMTLSVMHVGTINVFPKLGEVKLSKNHVIYQRQYIDARKEVHQQQLVNASKLCTLLVTVEVKC